LVCVRNPRVGLILLSNFLNHEPSQTLRSTLRLPGSGSCLEVYRYWLFPNLERNVISQTINGKKQCHIFFRREPTVFVYLIGASALVFMVVLAYGALTGRVKLDNGCCCPSDPNQDLRMRD